METSNNKLHGIYDTEETLQAEMDRLRDQGYNDEDMYIVSNENDKLSMYRGSAEYKNDNNEGSWWEKFKSFMSGDDQRRDPEFDQMGISHEDRDRYYEELRTGKYLLYVDKDYGRYYEGDGHAYDTTSGAADETLDEPRNLDSTLDKTKPIGYDPSQLSDQQKLDETKPVGYNNEETVQGAEAHNLHDTKPLDVDSTAPNVGDRTTNNHATSDHTTDEQRLALHEEQLEVDKKRVQTGEVQVDKHVVEEEQTFDVPVEREEVFIERRPVNQAATDSTVDPHTGETDAYEEDGSIHIPVTEEQVEVTKRDVVTEEIVVGKRKVQDTETVSETVRREEADIKDTTNTLQDDTVEHATGFDPTKDKDRGF
ncbi:DUF2382 domain-containing protein [Kurthia massiliensis]|uniref:DUF2382 domain-containing protein n=1 Tax=Kurthia massiliensis TaxID=1033739 RepID=UPI000287CD78|nr:DUF2382 domain-containing protein [Kurthia massiliensis]